MALIACAFSSATTVESFCNADDAVWEATREHHFMFFMYVSSIFTGDVETNFRVGVEWGVLD
jgi:hypothetical protein